MLRQRVDDRPQPAERRALELAPQLAQGQVESSSVGSDWESVARAGIVGRAYRRPALRSYHSDGRLATRLFVARRSGCATMAAMVSPTDADRSGSSSSTTTAAPSCVRCVEHLLATRLARPTASRSWSSTTHRLTVRDRRDRGAVPRRSGSSAHPTTSASPPTTSPSATSTASTTSASSTTTPSPSPGTCGPWSPPLEADPARRRVPAILLAPRVRRPAASPVDGWHAPRRRAPPRRSALRRRVDGERRRPDRRLRRRVLGTGARRRRARPCSGGAHRRALLARARRRRGRSGGERHRRSRSASPGSTRSTSGSTAGRVPVSVAVGTAPRWFDVPLAGEPYDVVNNVGSELVEGGWGGDRGFLQPDRGQFDEPDRRVRLVRRRGALPGALPARGRPVRRALLHVLRGHRPGVAGPGPGLALPLRARVGPPPRARGHQRRGFGPVPPTSSSATAWSCWRRTRPSASPPAAAGRYLLSTASYARRDVVRPVLGGHRPDAPVWCGPGCGSFGALPPHGARTLRDDRRARRDESRVHDEALLGWRCPSQ